jgi:hypothetical protein
MTPYLQQIGLLHPHPTAFTGMHRDRERSATEALK